MNGKDDFGHFVIDSGNCCYCHRIGLNLKYLSGTFKLPNGEYPVEVTTTILNEVRNSIGITCGCYAKFHRQVAHIKDNLVPR